MFNEALYDSFLLGESANGSGTEWLSEWVTLTVNVITQLSDRVVIENEMKEFKVRNYHLYSTLY